MWFSKTKKEIKCWFFSENGFGKDSDLKGYKIQRRGGSGIKTAKISPRPGNWFRLI